KALPGFTLDVEWSAGDGTAVLFGPSGSGKTLTLQCLAGLVRPDRGRVVVNGRTLLDTATGVDLPPQARRLGYVFQGYALFPHLSVADNLAFGLRGRPRAERQARVREVVARLGLGGLADRYPRELSGGQQQRVALGRALAPDPELVLLDEPLSALDAPLRRQLLEGANSPTRSYLPEPGQALAFYIRPEYVRLIRKDRGGPDAQHHTNLMSATVVREADAGTVWTLYLRLDEPGPPAQGGYDLEVEVPKLVYEILEIPRDRHWQISIHRGSIQVLPSA